MKVVESRLWVKLISSQALAQYMEHRGLTVRKLARRAGCSPATIGHLRSGARNTCRPKTAKAIEEALGAPIGSLFMPYVSYVTRDRGTAA